MQTTNHSSPSTSQDFIASPQNQTSSHDMMAQWQQAVEQGDSQKMLAVFSSLPLVMHIEALRKNYIKHAPVPTIRTILDEVLDHRDRYANFPMLESVVHKFGRIDQYKEMVCLKGESNEKVYMDTFLCTLLQSPLTSQAEKVHAVNEMLSQVQTPLVYAQYPWKDIGALWSDVNKSIAREYFSALPQEHLLKDIAQISASAMHGEVKQQILQFVMQHRAMMPRLSQVAQVISQIRGKTGEPAAAPAIRAG